MRFTIRDLLWLVLVVALGVGWWLDRQAAMTKSRQMYDQAERLRQSLRVSEVYIGEFVPKERKEKFIPDFKPLYETRVEP